MIAFSFDAAAHDWTADLESDPETGCTSIKISLPEGWATGDLYLVCVPFDAARWVKPIPAEMALDVKTSELGSRGYVYTANLQNGTQKNTPIITYRIRDGMVVALGW